MEIRIGEYFHNTATDSQREVHVTLTDVDGERLFPNKWGEWSVPTRMVKLAAMAEIQVLQYSARKGYRAEHAVKEDIENVIARDLT